MDFWFLCRLILANPLLSMHVHYPSCNNHNDLKCGKSRRETVIIIVIRIIMSDYKNAFPHSVCISDLNDKFGI